MKKSGSDKLEALKATVIYSGLGLGVATGAFFLIRHFLKKGRKKNAEKRSAEEGDPNTYAKQLHMAFQNDNYFGWGTNTNQVNEVFRAINSKRMYEKVQKAYFDLYGKSLNAQLEEELSSSEYNSVIRMLSEKRAK